MRIAIEEPMHGGGGGGLSVYIRNLLDQLAHLHPEHQFYLFGFFWRSRAEKIARLKPPSAPNFSLLIPRWPESLVTRLEWTLGAPWVEAYLRWKGVDLYHAHRVPRHPWVKTIVTVPDLFPVVHPEWASPFLQKLYRDILKPGAVRAEHVISISHHTKRDLIEHWNIPEDKITVVHLGIDTRLFKRQEDGELERVRCKYGLPARFLMMVGPFDGWCDPKHVIAALAGLGSAYADVGLALAGSQGSTAALAKAQARELGLEKRLFWTGYVPQADLIALYGAAAALAYPSLYEGFGLPVLEAMACQTPVVTSNTTSLPEVAGNAALLVDPEDEEDIREALRRILDDGDLRRRLRETGLARARGFSWEKTARLTWDVYQRTLRS